MNLSLGNISEIKNKTTKLDESTLYDVIIIGAGPAALTAAVYLMRKSLKTAIMSTDIGGQVLKTAGIENYMGYMHIEGMSLVDKFDDQVSQFEIATSIGNDVVKIENGTEKKVYLSDGSCYSTRTILVSSGQSSRKLNIPGESKFIGRGVAYCATCDAPLFRDRTVIVVGGGNSGVEAAIDLANIAKHVTLLQNFDTLTADKILIDKLLKFQNVKVLYNHSLLEIKGSEYVESSLVKDSSSNETYELPTDGVFIEIGYVPNTEFLGNLLDLNSNHEIIIDCKCLTSVPGIFAAGDVTSVPYKQIIIAAGEGAKAALSIVDYLHKN